jgi:hypothetical protein
MRWRSGSLRGRASPERSERWGREASRGQKGTRETRGTPGTEVRRENGVPRALEARGDSAALEDSQVLAGLRGRKAQWGRQESRDIPVCLAQAGLQGHPVLLGLLVLQVLQAHRDRQDHQAHPATTHLAGLMDNREKSQIERDVYVSLRDHFTALLAEQEKRLDERFEAQEKRWAAALGAQRSNVYILIVVALVAGLLALALVAVWFGAEAH